MSGAATLHVVCPHCLAVNRLAAARLADGARCGACHQPLFSGHPTALGSAQAEKFVADNEIPVLVDFWAPWCGPCQSMAPVFEKAAAQLEPRVRLAKINTEDEPALAQRYGIRSIPTLILFRGGREAARLSGALDLTQLLAWVRQHLQ